MSKPIPDIIGNRYGFLVAVKFVGRGKWSAEWLFECDCGNKVVKQLSNVRYSKRAKCGMNCKFGQKHGYSMGGNVSPTYTVWTNMKARCNNKKNPHYGGRGITYCKEWEYFPAFLEDMGEKPENMSIDRIDNNGNYTPENCRWADSKTQGVNRRTTNIYQYEGRDITLEEIAELTGLSYTTIVSRHSRKWPIEKIMTKGLFSTNGKELRTNV